MSQTRGRSSKPSHHPKDRTKYSYSEPPPTMVNARGDGLEIGRARDTVRDGALNRAAQSNKSSQQQAQSECAEGLSDSDMSDSSLSAHDGGGGRMRRYELGRSKKQSSLTNASSEAPLVSTCIVAFASGVHVS